MSGSLDRFKTAFNQLNKDRLDLLDEIYTPDVAFRDPVHELQGLGVSGGHPERLLHHKSPGQAGADDRPHHRWHIAGIHTVALQRRRHGHSLLLAEALGVGQQVPVEQGWDRLAYLDNLCLKAGVAPGSWKLPGAQLFWYEAVVFKANT